MQLLLGYVGLVCVIPLFPFALYALLTEVNVTWKIFFVLVGKGCLDFVITDYLLFRSVILTSATVASVGLGLTIPLAFLVDFVMGKLVNLSVSSVFGALSVATGFLIVNLGGLGSESPATLKSFSQDDSQRITERELPTLV